MVCPLLPSDKIPGQAYYCQIIVDRNHESIATDRKSRKDSYPDLRFFAPGSSVRYMMISEVSTIEDELALAQADSRDMKRTVITLRTELEAAHAEIHESTLRATQASAAEISQLKITVGALREELERSRVERDHAVQQERVVGHNEMQQFKATSAALRESLELAQIDRVNSINRERALFADEGSQLQHTIQTLRDQIEAMRRT